MGHVPESTPGEFMDENMWNENGEMGERCWSSIE